MSVDPVAEAVERVRRGGLVAYPTETLYGLGADARSARAVGRLRAWKGRREAQPLSVLVVGPEALEPLGLRASPAARRLLEALWPGPLTVVLPCAGGFAPGVARAADGAVGVRCSPHPVAAALARGLDAAGAGPVTATSLNRHGAAPAARREEARGLCADELVSPWLLEVPGAPEPGGAASTVVDATGDEPVVLRPGAVSREAVEAGWAGRAVRGVA